MNNYSAVSKPCVDLKYLHNAGYWKQRNLLEKGQFGQVYLYTHEIGEKFIIAVKRIKFGSSDLRSNKHLKALINEVNYLAHFSHVRLVGYLGTCFDYHNYILSVCLDYVPDTSLFTILQQGGPLDINTTMKFTCQILEGVEHLHKNCIIHRNIKGKNILVDLSKDVIKLTDFGILKQLEALAGDIRTVMASNIKWMAPEIFGEGKYGIKVDIWSIGCTVVEMLTKFPPWNNLTESQVRSKLTNRKYPAYKIKDQNENVEDFLNRCFEADPKNRPSAKDLQSTTFCQLSTGSPTTDFDILQPEYMPASEYRKPLVEESLPAKRRKLPEKSKASEVRYA